MIVLDRDAVYRYLPMRSCIYLMKDALSGLEDGLYGPPGYSDMEPSQGRLAYTPCNLGPRGSFGAKVVSIFPGNVSEGYPVQQGSVLLFESRHGTPLLMADADAITEIRTAALSAAATDALAREDCTSLAMLGSGAQAVTHLETMLAVRDIQAVSVWSYHRANAQRYADAMADRYPQLSFTVHDTPADAVRTADLICTVSRSHEPYLFRDMVRPGTHINAVGACSSTAREISSDLVAASCFYVDQVEACLECSGELLIPMQEGLINQDHIIGGIGRLFLDEIPGRVTQDDITLFDSVGLALEDVICADLILLRIRQEEQAIEEEKEFGPFWSL